MVGSPSNHGWEIRWVTVNVSLQVGVELWDVVISVENTLDVSA